jgi:hypothetical protein
MTPTAAGTVKEHAGAISSTVPTGFDLNKGIFNYSNHQKGSSKAQIAAYLLMILAVAERGGILSEHPKKFSVMMVKRKFNRINGRFDEKPFCQCHWEI